MQILQLVAAAAAVADDDSSSVGGEDSQDHAVHAWHVAVAGSAHRADAAAGAQRRHQPAERALLLERGSGS